MSALKEPSRNQPLLWKLGKAPAILQPPILLETLGGKGCEAPLFVPEGCKPQVLVIHSFNEY